MKKEFGEVLAALMQEKGITAEKLASVMDMTVSNVKGIVGGEYGVTADFIPKLVVAYDLRQKEVEGLMEAFNDRAR